MGAQQAKIPKGLFCAEVNAYNQNKQKTMKDKHRNVQEFIDLTNKNEGIPEIDSIKFCKNDYGISGWHYSYRLKDGNVEQLAAQYGQAKIDEKHDVKLEHGKYIVDIQYATYIGVTKNEQPPAIYAIKLVLNCGECLYSSPQVVDLAADVWQNISEFKVDIKDRKIVYFEFKPKDQWVDTLAVYYVQVMRDSESTEIVGGTQVARESFSFKPEDVFPFAGQTQMIGGSDNKSFKLDQTDSKSPKVKSITFLYGWCGHVFQIKYYDDQVLSVPKKLDKDAKTFQIEQDDQIVNLKMRYVHTTSYEFSSNIVGLVIKTRKGKVEVWEAFQYKNHSQKYYQIDLKDCVITGIQGAKSNHATHDVLASFGLILRSKNKSVPKFVEISRSKYIEDIKPTPTFK